MHHSMSSHVGISRDFRCISHQQLQQSNQLVLQLVFSACWSSPGDAKYEKFSSPSAGVFARTASPQPNRGRSETVRKSALRGKLKSFEAQRKSKCFFILESWKTKVHVHTCTYNRTDRTHVGTSHLNIGNWNCSKCHPKNSNMFFLSIICVRFWFWRRKKKFFVCGFS